MPAFGKTSCAIAGALRGERDGAVTIAPDLVAQILRLHTVEKWRVGTIARQLRVHRDTVRRVIAGNGAPDRSPLRAYRIDPYRPFVIETLIKFPTLTAARLHAMVGERGYVGSASHFRRLVAGMHPRRPAEAYLRLRTLPGEQAQVNWAHFGHLLRISADPGHRFQIIPDSVSDEAGHRFRLMPDGASA